MDRSEITRKIVNESVGDCTYNVSDCCHLLSNVVEAICGEDFSAEFKYSTRDEAFEIVHNMGGFSNLLSHLLGEPSPLNMLEDGDPVVFKIGSDEGVGVLLNSRIMTKTESGGVFALPLKLFKEGWHIDGPNSCRDR